MHPCSIVPNGNGFVILFPAINLFYNEHGFVKLNQAQVFGSYAEAASKDFLGYQRPS